jgi:hypothetical protein
MNLNPLQNTKSEQFVRKKGSGIKINCEKAFKWRREWQQVMIPDAKMIFCLLLFSGMIHGLSDKVSGGRLV